MVTLRSVSLAKVAVVRSNVADPATTVADNRRAN